MDTTVTTKPDLTTLFLANGGHGSREEGVCLLEAVAWFAGEKHSDHPKCTDVALAAYGRKLNDRLRDDERQQLRDLVPMLVGTRGSSELARRRAYLLIDRLRSIMPAWFRELPHKPRPDIAERLERLDPIVDASSAERARDLAREIRDDLRSGWSRSDAYAAAAYAAAAYAASAAADAAAASADAADAASAAAAAYAAAAYAAAAYAAVAYAAYADAAYADASAAYAASASAADAADAAAAAYAADAAAAYAASAYASASAAYAADAAAAYAYASAAASAASAAAFQQLRAATIERSIAAFREAIELREEA